jgi:hypothetical protein
MLSRIQRHNSRSLAKVTIRTKGILRKRLTRRIYNLTIVKNLAIIQESVTLRRLAEQTSKLILKASLSNNRTSRVEINM